MKILVACEESQAVTIELRSLGHEAYSCDIQNCSGGHPEWHITGDVIPLLNGRCSFNTTDGTAHEILTNWDMIIGFPPCTKTSNAGACHLFRGGHLNLRRLYEGLCGKAFFLTLWNAECAKIILENPTPSTIFEYPKPSQVIQPYLFDEFDEHPYTKKTLLWEKGVAPLVPTTPDKKPVGPYVPAGTGRKDRSKYGAAKRGEDAKNRSKTFHGIARAMAIQFAGEA